MKKGYLAAGVVGGAVGTAIAWKMMTRAASVNFEEVAHLVKNSQHSKFIEIDGIRVHYQEFGNPKHPKLLLIHGYTASTYSWHKVAPIFAERGFHVIAPDLVGFGYTAKPHWFDYSIVSQARVISRLMNRLGIGRAIVGGCSYGGAIAATLALDYPEFVEKLILVDAVINDDLKRNHPVFKLAKLPGVGEVVSAFLVDSDVFVRGRMHSTLAPENHHLITEERIASSRRPLAAADAHYSALQTIRLWAADRVEHDAHLISQPTLIVWGENDTVIPVENGRKLHESILHSRLMVIRKCGHVPQEERPEIFTDVVTEFIKHKKGKLESKDDGQMRIEA